MKKSIFILVFIFIVGHLGWSQNACTPWFPFSSGTSFEYTYFNKKDKVTSRVMYTIKDVKQSAGSFSCMVAYTIFDKKGKETSSSEFVAQCSDGAYKADFSNFINPEMYEAYQGAEITVTGDQLIMPEKLSVGASLPDASVHMEVKMGLVIKMDSKLTNRKVEEEVKIKTPVKEFDAVKVSADEYFKVPLYTRNAKANYYYAQGYGQVKYESFDKKGNLSAYMLLTKFNKP
jgi:hypothetical protein